MLGEMIGRLRQAQQNREAESQNPAGSPGGRSAHARTRQRADPAGPTARIRAGDESADEGQEQPS